MFTQTDKLTSRPSIVYKIKKSSSYKLIKNFLFIKVLQYFNKKDLDGVFSI